MDIKRPFEPTKKPVVDPGELRDTDVRKSDTYQGRSSFSQDLMRGMCIAFSTKPPTRESDSVLLMSFAKLPHTIRANDITKVGYLGSRYKFRE